jgi:RNA-directed DNA polymerase
LQGRHGDKGVMSQLARSSPPRRESGGSKVRLDRRLREDLALLEVAVNEEKSRAVDLANGGSFGFRGFDIRRSPSRLGCWFPLATPKLKQRTELLAKLRMVFVCFRSQPVHRVIERINTLLQGWVDYFANGHASRCFSFVRDWVEKKVRRHLSRNSKRHGFAWKKWSTPRLVRALGLFND